MGKDISGICSLKAVNFIQRYSEEQKRPEKEIAGLEERLAETTDLL